MERVCIYLRKSREDIDAEKINELETLSKHRRTLLKLAKDKSYNIVHIYEELASGESLVFRSEMMKLLKDVESKLYNAVLVMDVDRLGRGDMEEQGLILKTFKNSNTKIITPRKIYDLNDEFDEEYSEFEAFMARKELKIINRRLQRGRIRSIEEGNYLGTNAPIGYEFEYIGKERILKISEQNAEIIRIIFELYVKGDGAHKVATTLNKMGYKSATGIEWSNSSVLNIIKNPIYAGYVTWKKVLHDRIKNERKLQPKASWIVAKGKHESIVSDELYNRAKEILEKRYHIPYNTKLTNPLSGLIVCANCGSTMILRPYPNCDSHIICLGKCGNKSSKFKYIEEKILEELDNLLSNYKIQYDNVKCDNNSMLFETYKKQLKSIETELSEIEKQKNNLHDLLEREIYDIETYISRSNILATRTGLLNEDFEKIIQLNHEEEFRVSAKNSIIPQIESALQTYMSSDDAYRKNLILKSVIEKVVYKKEKSQRNDEFTLTIYPKQNMYS